MTSLKQMAVLLVLQVLAGCSTTQMSSRQLERVAKDWCLTIRASQVLPVYPLTEDVQPGDVFLVQTPIRRQVEVYKERGFLPLDNHLTRLAPKSGDYESFYGKRYDVSAASNPPGPWQFGPSSYGRAPLAAFPSYSFSVSRSEGLNIAVPVHAIPVGLNLLDSASASGSVTIKDAVTYGLDMQTMWNEVSLWAARNSSYLQQFAPATNSKGERVEMYLRVVYRVYLAKRMEVTLHSDEAFAGSVSAGVPRPVSLLSLGAKDTQAATNFEAVNKVLKEAFSPTTQPSTPNPITTPTPNNPAAPTPEIGGTLKVAMASGRSVSLVETFDRPLCIGYLAMDLPIRADGSLDGPLSTLVQLQAPGAQAMPNTIKYGTDENSRLLKEYLKTHRGEVEQWLRDNDFDVAPEDLVLGAKYASTRARIVTELNINRSRP